MVKVFVRGQKVNTAAAAVLRIIRAKNAQAKTRHDNRPRAHGARFQGDVQRTTCQAARIKRESCPLQRQHFGVSQGRRRTFPLVMS